MPSAVPTMTPEQEAAWVAEKTRYATLERDVLATLQELGPHTMSALAIGWHVGAGDVGLTLRRLSRENLVEWCIDGRWHAIESGAS